MVRAFTAADIVQSVPGTAAGTDAPSPALNIQTVGGRAGIIIVGTPISIDPHANWHFAAWGGADPSLRSLAVMCRTDIPDGEISWTFGTAGGPSNWCWVAEEWANLSYAPVVGWWNDTAGAPNPATYTLGPTNDWGTVPYVVAVAALLLINGTTGGTVWPSVSWSDGFVTTDTQSIGTGTTSNDVRLLIARRYGTLNEAGPWSTTATLTGAMTNKTVYGAHAVFRAENYVGEA